MNTQRFYWLIASALLLVASANASVTIQLVVDTHVEPGTGSQNTPADSHVSIDVTLANDNFVVKLAKETVVYDFDKRKRVVIDNDTKTRVDYSLFDTVGFRVFELRNRDMLGKSMAAANVGQVVMAALDNEHILAIQDKPSAPLQARIDGTDMVFSNDSKVLFRRGQQSTPVSPAEARIFAQFVRYTFGGHPQILAELARANSIPAQLVLVTHDIGVTTRTIVVKGIRPGDAVPVDVSVFPARQATASTDPLDQALDRAVAIGPGELSLARQRSMDELASAFRGGRGLDAFLGMMEWTLMTGEGVPPLTPEQKNLLQADTAIRKLNSALAPKTKEDLSSAIDVFAELKPAATTKAYVLKIFEANDRGMLGDRSAARKLFLEVLTFNPNIAGVYKDLGDNLITGFDMPRAWRCWDIGRRIAPQFANFGPVNQFERSLAAGHPEFF
ncbi:MAG: hypothetical protein H7346_16605 [Burkholderiaceae bacterium]|nr:hypothetical protein [Burkholderiaceae bacterium]